MIGYFKTMMRKEPVTFGVMLLMIGILAFGAWKAMPQPKKSAASQTYSQIA